MTGKIAAPNGLGIVDELKLARALTQKPIKATVPGPYTLLVPLKLGGGYRDKDTLLADLVEIVNAECKALVAAGANFIQIDEPHHGLYAGSVHDVTRGINRAVEGVVLRQSLRPPVQRRARLLQRLPDARRSRGVTDQGARRRRHRREGVQVGGFLQHIAPDKLWLNPDCGFWETPRWVVKQKLAALCAGAAIVRREL